MVEDSVIEAVLRMLNTLSLQELILSGKLDIFNNSKWKTYWKSCNVRV